MKSNDWKLPLVVLAFVVGAALFFRYQPKDMNLVASWVQAFGSIVAIIAAFTIADRQQKNVEKQRFDELQTRRDIARQTASILVEKLHDTAVDLVRIATRFDRTLYAEPFAERLRDQRDGLAQVSLIDLKTSHAVAVVAARDLASLMIAHLTTAPEFPPG